MVDALQCPSCDGRGSSAGFICFADGSDQRSGYNDAIQCSLCRGAGSISLETAERFRIGREHYKARVARDESLMECAKRLGLKPSELSAMEHGRAPVTRIVGDA